jgi:hypothetical protein
MGPLATQLHRDIVFFQSNNNKGTNLTSSYPTASTVDPDKDCCLVCLVAHSGPLALLENCSPAFSKFTRRFVGVLF